MNIHRWLWAPLAEMPPQKHSIDEQLDEDSHQFFAYLTTTLI